MRIERGRCHEYTGGLEAAVWELAGDVQQEGAADCDGAGGGWLSGIWEITAACT